MDDCTSVDRSHQCGCFTTYGASLGNIAIYMTNAWILFGHCTLNPYQFNDIPVIQCYFIVVVDCIFGIRIEIRGSYCVLHVAWDTTGVKSCKLAGPLILKNDVWSPETPYKWFNKQYNSAQTICNIINQFRVCRLYGPSVCCGTSYTVASHELWHLISLAIWLFAQSLFWLTVLETSKSSIICPILRHPPVISESSHKGPATLKAF